MVAGPENEESDGPRDHGCGGLSKCGASSKIGYKIVRLFVMYPRYIQYF